MSWFDEFTQKIKDIDVVSTVKQALGMTDTDTKPKTKPKTDLTPLKNAINSVGTNKYTNIDLSKYANGFQASDELNGLLGLKTNAEDAVTNFANNYGRENEYQSAMDAILNRGKFSYDLNGDALYQQYKDNYMNQGKQAMMDTMGQASAMTGGYGNSYAATVGNQTYQGYLQGLNDVVPQLYQMALDRYNAEGDRLATNYSLLSADRTNEYNKAVSDRDYYGNNYNNAYNREYSAYNDQRTYDSNQYWSEYNAGYTKEQDAIANQMALAQLEETIRANGVSESQRSAANQLAREQWEYTRDNPTVTYSIDNFSEIPEHIYTKLDGMNNIEKIKAYINYMVDSEEMSPAVAVTLADYYEASLKDNTETNIFGQSTGSDNKGEYYIDANGNKH